MLNSCIFSGRFASDPKFFEGENGSRCVFTLAIDRDRRNGEGVYEADFLDFVSWNGKANFVSTHFAKGDPAIVTARAQVRRFTDKNGEQRRNVEFLVDNIYFGQGKRVEEG